MATVNLPDDMPDDVKELFGQSIIDVAPSYQYVGDTGEVDPSRTGYTAVVNNPEGGVTRYSYDPTQGLLNTGSFGSYGELMQDAQDDDIFTKFGDFALKAAPVVFAGANLYNLANSLGAIGTSAVGTAPTAADISSGLWDFAPVGANNLAETAGSVLDAATAAGANLANATGALPLDQVGALNPPTGLDSLPTSQFPGDLVKPEVNLGGMTSEGSGALDSAIKAADAADFTKPGMWDYPRTAPSFTEGIDDLSQLGYRPGSSIDEFGEITGPEGLHDDFGRGTDMAGDMVDAQGNRAWQDVTAEKLRELTGSTALDSAGRVRIADALTALTIPGLTANQYAAAKKAIGLFTGGNKPTGTGTGAGGTTIVKAGGNDSLLAAIMAMAAKTPSAGGDGGVAAAAAADAARQAAQALTRG